MQDKATYNGSSIPTTNST